MNKKPPLPLGSFHGNGTDTITISGNSSNPNPNNISHISNINNISHIGSISNCSSINSSPILGNIGAGNSTTRMGRQGVAGGASSSNAGGASGSGGGSAAAGGTGSGSSSSASSTSKGDKQRDGDDDGGFGLCGCHKAPKSHCISATGVLLLVLLYTALGSIVFVTLEGELEEATALETAVAASKPYPRTELANAEIRSRTVDRLWSITEDLNILYKENWTRLAAQEVQLFQDTLLRAVRQSKVYQPGGVQMNAPTHKWTYASAFLYSLTLITTIGFGGVSPRTQWGRIAALIYALFGIPIVLLYLSAMGEALSAGMRCLFRRQGHVKGNSSNGSGNSNGTCNGSGSSGSRSGKSEKNKGQQQYGGGGKYGGGGAGASSVYQQQQQREQREQQQHREQREQQHREREREQKENGEGRQKESSSVPISICVCVLVCYVTSGAILFHKLQNWSVLESLYFCFTSLGTIGFGELSPSGTLTLYTASAYILVGMAVVAMCFSLIQTEIVMWLRRFSVQDHVSPKTEELAIVTVAVTPKAS